MAITKADILKSVVKRLGGMIPAPGEIDTELGETLAELTSRLGGFYNQSNVLTTASTAGYTLSDNIKSIVSVWIDGGNVLEMGDYTDYRQTVESTSSPTTGEPTKWAYEKGTIYLYDPIPDDAYTVYIDNYYVQYTPGEYIRPADRYLASITAGVIKRLWQGRAAADERAQSEANKWHVIFEQEIEILRAGQSRVLKIKYWDA